MCTIAELIPECGTNAPGVTEILWTEVNDIDSIPPMNIATLTISTDIIMVATKTFKSLVTIREETFFDDEMMGSTDSLHFMHQLTAKVKGMTPAVDAALNAAAGAKCVLLIKLPDGNVRLLGNKTNYAEVITMKSSTGKIGSQDKKGTDIIIKSVGHMTKAPYYTGVIPV